MWQHRALDSGPISAVRVMDALDQFAVFGEFKDSLPEGLIGLDLETGLVEVQVDKVTKRFMKFGKMLYKLGVPESTIPDLSASMSTLVKQYAGVKLEIARTGDEIEFVYETGPTSCMSTSRSVRAYESPNIGVGFAQVEDRIVARAVLNLSDEENPMYSTIYGDSKLLKSLLEVEGYTSGDLEGCTLSKIEEDDIVLCPYLDCGTRATIGEYSIELTNYGEHSTQDVDGYLNTRRCERCGDTTNQEEEMYCSEREESMCSDCWDNTTVWLDGSTYWVGGEKVAETEDGEYYLIDDVVQSSRGCIHMNDSILTFEDEYEHKEDCVEAIVDDSEDVKTCLQDSCTEVDDVWVFDDYLDEYIKNKEDQLELGEIEPKEEAIEEVMAFIKHDEKMLVPVRTCLLVRGLWVHREFQIEYSQILDEYDNLLDMSPWGAYESRDV